MACRRQSCLGDDRTLKGFDRMELNHERLAANAPTEHERLRRHAARQAMGALPADREEQRRGARRLARSEASPGRLPRVGVIWR